MSGPTEATDWLLIERVLCALWAPTDADPSRPAEMLNDALSDPLTVQHVIKALNALERLRLSERE